MLSDMAPNASGNHTMDHQRIMVSATLLSSLYSTQIHDIQELCRSAYLLAESVLKTGGTFICKLWQGSQTNCRFWHASRFDSVFEWFPHPPQKRFQGATERRFSDSEGMQVESHSKRILRSLHFC